MTNNEWLAVGTYTDRDEPGIHLYQMNRHTGEMSPIRSATGVDNPSFLALHPRENVLYAVSETLKTEEGHPGGSVVALGIDSRTGRLQILNRQPTQGEAPCHVSVDPQGEFICVANYMGGSVTLFPLKEDGTLEEPSDSIRHEGKGVRLDRQEAPHPHSVFLDAKGTFAYVPDLGIDRVVVYRVDRTEKRLQHHDELRMNDGAGPRHLAFHPKQPWVYIVNELDSTVIVCAYDERKGRLEPQQAVSALPASFKKENTAADIHVSPCGSFVYVSNRGHDSLVVYRVDAETGGLTWVRHHDVDGETPRNFAISPDGRYVLSANQDTDEIVVFAVDEQSGCFERSVYKERVQRPVCIRYFQERL